jgi:hypothetical protein
MKRTMLWFGLGLALGILPLITGCSQAQADPTPDTNRIATAEIPSAPVLADPVQVVEATEPVSVAAAPLESTPSAELIEPIAAVSATNAASTVGVPPIDPTTASAKVLPAEKVVPAHVRTFGPLSEVIRLAESGSQESVLLAFVTNSASTFNPNADEIIYLNDIGVPSSVIVGMIQHDQRVQSIPPASEATTTPPAPVSQYAPIPESSAQYATPGVNPTAPEATPAYPVEQAAPPAPVEIADSTFYDELTPYGTWVDVEGYGPCWQPTVVVANSGWRPYFDGGHWVYTDCGWYWLSDYSWGWAPFHYGRWFQHQRLGWCWLPDRVWGPSWVSWRYTEGYCGWAPMPPGALYTAGIGLTYWGRGVAVGFDFNLGPGSYAFIAWGHFHDRSLRYYAMAPANLNRVFLQSTVTTRITGNHSTVANVGLPVDRVMASTHEPVRKVALQESPPANMGGRGERLNGSSGTLSVFRPTLGPSRPGVSVVRSTVAQPRPAPDRNLRPAAAANVEVPGAVSRTTPGTIAQPSQAAGRVYPAGSMPSPTRNVSGPASPPVPVGGIRSLPRSPVAGPVPGATSVDEVSRPLNPTATRPVRPAPTVASPASRPASDTISPSPSVPRYSTPVEAPRYQPAPAAPRYTAPSPAATVDVPRYSPAPSDRSYSDSVSSPRSIPRSSATFEQPRISSPPISVPSPSPSYSAPAPRFSAPAPVVPSSPSISAPTRSMPAPQPSAPVGRVAPPGKQR